LDQPKTVLRERVVCALHQEAQSRVSATIIAFVEDGTEVDEADMLTPAQAALSVTMRHLCLHGGPGRSGSVAVLADLAEFAALMSISLVSRRTTSIRGSNPAWSC